MKRLSLPLAVVALVLLAWLLWQRTRPTDSPAAPTTDTSPPPVAQRLLPDAELPSPSPPAFPLNSSATDIAADLRLLTDTIETFRTNFLHTGNPVGENVEITAALTGKNPLHLALIPPGHPAINAHGELCDRWGTPFFFHQLSGTQTEIRSAGPDKIFRTADDALLTP